MKIPKPFLIEIAINIIISLLMYGIISITVFKEENPFNNSVQGFLAFFIILSFLDIVYKLIKKLIKKNKK